MRMIDGDELYRRVCEEGWYDNDDREQVLDLIDGMNEAVVRCRDCKYCHTYYRSYDNIPTECDWWLKETHSDAFCSYGKRK